MRDDEELGIPREVADIIEIEIVNFSYVVFQVQDNDMYHLEFGSPSHAVEF